MGAATPGLAFEHARREHGALTSDLTDLQGLVESPDLQSLQSALDAFLSQWGPRLEAHLEAESRLVSPRVGHSLPDETGILDTFHREGELFSTVLQLLSDARGWLEDREPGAQASIAAAVRDLSSLWGQHLRRVEILAPLLSRLQDNRRA